MTIKSMTGFARAEGAVNGLSWHWELRSVNARGLDVRQRLPAGCESLEPKVREAAGRHLVRGSVTIALNSDHRERTHEIRLNEEALLQVMKAAERIRELTDAAPPHADSLIAVKGVLDVAEKPETPEGAQARIAAMLESFNEALHSLVVARSAEGARLAVAIGAHLAEIERLVDAIESSPARQPAAIAQRLKDQIGRLLESSNGLDPDRLHQEAVLIATRADVAEELNRLRAHLGAARELMEEEGAVGRKLDFLAQEFNREANTLCAKANDVEISRTGLALKTVIDQMREQVQNIE